MQERNSNQETREHQNSKPGFEKKQNTLKENEPVADVVKKDEVPRQDNKIRSGQTAGAGEETLGIP